MRKLTVTANVTLDGVMQAPGRVGPGRTGNPFGISDPGTGRVTVAP